LLACVVSRPSESSKCPNQPLWPQKALNERPDVRNERPDVRLSPKCDLSSPTKYRSTSVRPSFMGVLTGARQRHPLSDCPLCNASASFVITWPRSPGTVGTRMCAIHALLWREPRLDSECDRCIDCFIPSAACACELLLGIKQTPSSVNFRRFSQASHFHARLSPKCDLSSSTKYRSTSVRPSLA